MKTLFLFVLLLATGCAGKVAEHNQYLLRSPQAMKAPASDVPARLVIGDISVAPYIDQAGLVLARADGSIRVAHNHQWAEPVRSSARSFLASEISAALGEPVSRRSHGVAIPELEIDARIDQLHGTDNGDAVLVASWTVIDAPKRTVLIERGFSRTQPLASDGYAALVDAEVSLLKQLAAAIAASIPSRQPAQKAN